MRCVRELVSTILESQEKLTQENENLKVRMTSYEKVSEINVMMKEEVEELKRENVALKKSCKKYEEALKDLNDKVKNSPSELKSEIEENKMVELRNEWKKEQEEEKIKFTEVVRRQIQEKTKDTVIQVIKEKEELVRDTVDKRKCLVIFGLREKKIPNKYVREKEERTSEASNTICPR